MKLMKIIMSALLVAGAASSYAAPQQDARLANEVARVAVLVQQLETTLAAQNLINWQVGEFHKVNIKLSLPFPGNGTKYVSKEEPARNAFWYINEMTVLGQAQKTEALMDRSNGKVLELIVNGKKEDTADDSTMEILEQFESTVEVPAGKFDCMYVKAKVTQKGQTQELEAWLNPIDVNLDGMLKVKVQSQMGPVEMLLKEFGKK